MMTIDNHDAKVFTDDIELSAVEQINQLLAVDVFGGCKIRIMPDVHAGAGCVIGFTGDLGERVIPNIVGVDIGCGIRVRPFVCKKDIDWHALNEFIVHYIPSGRNHRNGDYAALTDKYMDGYREAKEIVKDLRCNRELKENKRLYKSVGTLGGGNHFIEVDREEELSNVSVENLYNLSDYDNLKRLHDVLHPQNKMKQLKKEEARKMAAPQYTMRYSFGTVLQNKVTNVEWFYLFSTPYGHWVYNAEFGFVEQINESNLRNSEKEDEDAQLTEQGRRELMSTVMDLKKKKKHAQFRAVLRDIRKKM